MPRRRIFDESYGSAKTEQAKPGGKLPPPMTSPPVPLSMQPPPPQAQGPMPLPGEQELPPGQMPQGLEQMLQQLLARFKGGPRG